MIQTLLLALSSILIIVGPITYILSIVRGVSKPHRMTRFIVFFVTALNFASILAAKGNLGAIIFAGIIVAQATVILLLSFWRGMGGASKLDFVCLGIAFLGLVGWKITGNPILGVFFSIIADFAAYIPAFVKTWKHPLTESPWYYLTGGLSAVFGLMAYPIEPASIFQFYIIISCVIMFTCIYHKKFHI